MLLTDRLLAVTFAVSIGLLGVGGYNQRVEKCNNWHAPLEYPEYCDGILEREANEESYREFPATLKQAKSYDGTFLSNEGHPPFNYTYTVEFNGIDNVVTYDDGMVDTIVLTGSGKAIIEGVAADGTVFDPIFATYERIGGYIIITVSDGRLAFDINSLQVVTSI